MTLFDKSGDSGSWEEAWIAVNLLSAAYLERSSQSSGRGKRAEAKSDV